MRLMLSELKELWKFRELLVSLIERELKIRYKNSYLGFFWSLLNPLITVAVMTVVFKYLLNNNTGNLSAYILAAYLPYMFFQVCLMDSAQSVLQSISLVKKIYFPREVLPLASICANFIHFLLAMAVFFLYLLVIWARHPGVPTFHFTSGGPGGGPSMLWLPVALLINFALSLGFGLLVSALNTFYEDVKYVVGVALYLLFFLCPVMYFSETVQYNLQKYPWGSAAYAVYHLNPVAVLSTSYKKILLAPQPVVIDARITVPAMPMDWGQFAYAAAFAFGMLWFGYSVFNRMKWRFVERP